MKIKRIKHQKTMTVQAFAKKHTLIMVIDDFGQQTNGYRYRAQFENTEILQTVSGYGSTEKEAIHHYAALISNKTLIVHGGTKLERQIQCPTLDNKYHH